MTTRTTHRFAALVVAALVAMAAAPAAQAQWGSPAQRPQRGVIEQQRGGDPGARMKQRLETMQQQLGLSYAQVEQIRRANEDHQRDWQRYQQAAARQGGLTAQQQAEWRNLQNGYRQRVQGVLTAQQRQRFAAMRGDRMQNGRSAPSNGAVDHRRRADRDDDRDHRNGTARAQDDDRYRDRRPPQDGQRGWGRGRP